MEWTDKTENDIVEFAHVNALQDHKVDKDTFHANVKYKEYGAKGDDVTDDIIALNNALEDGAGRRVFMPEGSFLISAPLKVYDNTDIRGVSASYGGSGGTRIKLANGSNCNMIENVDPAAGNRYIGIRDIYFNGNKANQASGKGLYFVKGKNVELVRVKFNQIHDEAVYLKQGKENKVLRIDTMNVDIALVLDAEVDDNVSFCQLTTSDAGHGIYMLNSANNNILTENFVFISDMGIYVAGSHFNQFNSNRFNTNSHSGMTFFNSHKNVVNGNRCFDNGTAGAGARHGMVLDGACEGNVVNGNICRNQAGTDQQVGIKLDGTVFDNIVTDNNLIGNADKPLEVVTANWNLIEDNLGHTGVQQTFTNGDTTPSVLCDKHFLTANLGATIITMFDNGYRGQQIKIIFGDAVTTLDFTGTNLKGNAGVDWTPASGDWLEAVFDGTNWYCSCHDCTA